MLEHAVNRAVWRKTEAGFVQFPFYGAGAYLSKWFDLKTLSGGNDSLSINFVNTSWAMLRSSRLIFIPVFLTAAKTIEPFKEPLFGSLQACVNLFWRLSALESFNGCLSKLLFHVRPPESFFSMETLYMENCHWVTDVLKVLTISRVTYVWKSGLPMSWKFSNRD